MTTQLEIEFVDAAPGGVAAASGALVAFWTPDKDGAPIANMALRALRGRTVRGPKQIDRALDKAKGEFGEISLIMAPHRMAADALLLVCRGPQPLSAAAARRLGGKIAKALIDAKVETATIRVEGLAGRAERAAVVAELAFGLRLMCYRFDKYKADDGDAPKLTRVAVAGPEKDAAKAAYAPLAALADGVETTRDLVNEPANVLTPKEFARRIEELKKDLPKAKRDKLAIEILDEKALEKLGMRTLLAVGQGSAEESYVAIMRWTGADKKAAPVCLIGKGVCFDTGGISLKPPAGMEEMTMDMGGAGVVVGAMRALALRGAKANVVGMVGLVENMPSDRAQRPGDIVKSMSGKTVEVINTDAEGRLVLADLLWHAQEAYEPRWIVNLATLTGAIIIALGHEKAGLFSNDDALAGRLLGAAGAEGEGLWRMPLDDAYDRALKSRLADMKNVGGRPAGSITAAQFLQRFVKDGTPWAHIDIAGVTLPKEGGATWRQGPSGWGVATLVRLVEESFAN